MGCRKIINRGKNSVFYDFLLKKILYYHINKLIYKDREDFEAKQESLAKLIGIYFLTRLKKIEPKKID